MLVGETGLVARSADGGQSWERLPDFYNEAIHGVPIGPNTGSCGTAMHTGERVIVADIQQHPYWRDYKALAARIEAGELAAGIYLASISIGVGLLNAACRTT